VVVGVETARSLPTVPDVKAVTSRAQRVDDDPTEKEISVIPRMERREPSKRRWLRLAGSVAFASAAAAAALAIGMSPKVGGTVRDLEPHGAVAQQLVKPVVAQEEPAPLLPSDTQDREKATEEKPEAPVTVSTEPTPSAVSPRPAPPRRTHKVVPELAQDPGFDSILDRVDPGLGPLTMDPALGPKKVKAAPTRAGAEERP
jgi:hypothetical protein